MVKQSCWRKISSRKNILKRDGQLPLKEKTIWKCGKRKIELFKVKADYDSGWDVSYDYGEQNVKNDSFETKSKALKSIRNHIKHTP